MSICPSKKTSTEMSKDHARIEMDLVCGSLLISCVNKCLLNVLFPCISKFNFIVLYRPWNTTVGLTSTVPGMEWGNLLAVI